MKTKYAIARNFEKTGNHLAALRTNSGYTQKEVADALGYSSAQFISNFERGIAMPPAKKFKKLCKFLKLSEIDKREVVGIYAEDLYAKLERALGL